MTYWTHLLRLLDIVGFAQRTVVSFCSSCLNPQTGKADRLVHEQYAVRKTYMWTRLGMTQAEWNEKIVKELDELLARWVDGVPEHRKWPISPFAPPPMF